MQRTLKSLFGYLGSQLEAEGTDSPEALPEAFLSLPGLKIRCILGLYRDNGRENEGYYST